jgi:hypothetical protein
MIQAALGLVADIGVERATDRSAYDKRIDELGCASLHFLYRLEVGSKSGGVLEITHAREALE